MRKDTNKINHENKKTYINVSHIVQQFMDLVLLQLCALLQQMSRQTMEFTVASDPLLFDISSMDLNHVAQYISACVTCPNTYQAKRVLFLQRNMTVIIKSNNYYDL